MWRRGSVTAVIPLVLGCGRLEFEARHDASSVVATDGDATFGDGLIGTGCAGDLAPRAWDFTSGLAGWLFSPDSGYTAQYAWTSALGNPEPGALEIDISGPGRATLGWALAPTPFGDLRGRIASARVWTSSSDVIVKLYAQNADNSWADGGIIELEPDQWTCLRLHLDSPAYIDPTFDASAVAKFGIEVEGTPPVHVVIDDAGY